MLIHFQHFVVLSGLNEFGRLTPQSCLVGHRSTFQQSARYIVCHIKQTGIFEAQSLQQGIKIYE